MATKRLDTSESGHVQQIGTTCTTSVVTSILEEDTLSLTRKIDSSSEDTLAVAGDSEKEGPGHFEGGSMSLQDVNRFSLMNPVATASGTEPVLSIRMLMNSRVSSSYLMQF